jgi:hypothetical protein
MHFPRWQFFLAVLLCFAFSAPAQIGTSTLTGLVTDPTGAVIQGVKVNITSIETNFRYEATTNPEGLYRVQSLNPGTYRIEFDPAAGFKRLVREGITLRTGDTLAVDVTLELGSTSESIQVTGAAPLLETETSATGSVVQGKVVYELPLFQRYIQSTFDLIPGMNPQGAVYERGLSGFHVAGQRSSSIGLFEDGVNANDQLGGTSTIQPIENSVEEVKVLTTTLPAEFGHSAGGVMTVVKKTGTNEFHGMASEYGRTRSMEHRGFFYPYKTSQPQPGAPNGLDTYFQMPDFNFSGPVVIPKVYNGRNRTFFFFSKAYLLEREGASFVWTNPTPEMLKGNFTLGGVGAPLYDPASTRQNADGTWSRDPIPGNIISPSRFDSVANNIIALNPWKPVNMPGTNTSTGPVSNLGAGIQTHAAYDEYSDRVDHQFGPNFKIYQSWTYNHVNGFAYDRNMYPGPLDNRTGNYTPSTRQNFSFGSTWIINPSTVNDARLGYFRNYGIRFVQTYNQNWGAKIGIPNISPEMMPSFNSGNGDVFGPDTLYGLTNAGPSRSAGETISFRDDLSKMRGTHAFKLGYEILRFRADYWTIDRPSGLFSFASMTSGLQANGQPMPNTGNTFAGFELGYVAQATFNTYTTNWLPRSAINSFYFQDDWKVSRKLTLNLGIRYSNESPFNTKYGAMSNFDPTAIDSVTGKVGAIVHPTGSIWKRDNNNFQPRIGLAWHPLEKWVLRGGFGLNTVDVKYPSSFGQFQDYQAINNQQQLPGDPRPIFRLSQGPAPVVYNIGAKGIAPYVGTNYGSRTADWWDPNLRNPYVLNYSVAAQYELRRDYLLEGSYQGSAGVGLVERWQANTFPIDYAANNPTLQSAVFAASQNYRPYPQFGDILFRSNTGHSTYNGGTIKLDKRFSSQGLVFSTSYTYSKTIDNQDDDNTAGAGVAPLQNRSLEKGRAGFDREHRYIALVTYDLPLGKGKRFMNRGRITDLLLGGYNIAWTQDAESGNPLTFTFTNSPYNYYPTFAGSRRPNLVGTPVLRDNWRDFGGNRFDVGQINAVMSMSYFSAPAAFTPGNAGRNIMTGLPLIWSCSSVKKDVRITERFRLMFRWDWQNVLKTYNFTSVSTTVDFRNPQTFGKVSADAVGAVHGGYTMHHLTVLLRF